MANRHDARNNPSSPSKMPLLLSHRDTLHGSPPNQHRTHRRHMQLQCSLEKGQTDPCNRWFLNPFKQSKGMRAPAEGPFLATHGVVGRRGQAQKYMRNHLREPFRKSYEKGSVSTNRTFCCEIQGSLRLAALSCDTSILATNGLVGCRGPAQNRCSNHTNVEQKRPAQSLL